MEETDKVVVRALKMTYTSSRFSYGQVVYLSELLFGNKAICVGNFRANPLTKYERATVDFNRGVTYPEIKHAEVNKSFAEEHSLEIVPLEEIDVSK